MLQNQGNRWPSYSLNAIQTDRQTDRHARTHARTSDEVDPAKIDNRELKTVLLTDINHCKSSKRKAGFHKTT